MHLRVAQLAAQCEDTVPASSAPANSHPSQSASMRCCAACCVGHVRCRRSWGAACAAPSPAPDRAAACCCPRCCSALAGVPPAACCPGRRACCRACGCSQARPDRRMPCMAWCTVICSYRRRRTKRLHGKKHGFGRKGLQSAVSKGAVRKASLLQPQFPVLCTASRLPSHLPDGIAQLPSVPGVAQQSGRHDAAHQCPDKCHHSLVGHKAASQRDSASWRSLRHSWPCICRRCSSGSWLRGWQAAAAGAG